MQSIKTLIANLRALGLPKLAALGGTALAMLLLFGGIMLRSDTANALLYKNLDPREASEITEQLAKGGISYRLDDNGDTIFVPKDKVAPARLLLAKSGLPSTGSIGYEIFDKGSDLTATEFEQNIAETRAMEGELERSIMLINGIQKARVHIVLRHRDLFSTSEQSAQASVLISKRMGTYFGKESISAIANLVAAAIPGLSPNNITIVDNLGHVLLRAGADTQGDDHEADEYRKELETHATQAIENLLVPILGFDHVHAEATAVINTTRHRETRERYDPEQQVLRSQHTKDDKSITNDNSNNVSVANNLPNSSAPTAKNISQNTKQEETNNYEIGKTVSVIEQQQPELTRMSIAVTIDGIESIDKDGKPNWQPHSEKEINHIKDLVKSAVGFDEKRGDTIEVISMKFLRNDNPARETGSNAYQSVVSKVINESAFRFISCSLILLLIILFVARPLIKNGENTEQSRIELGSDRTFKDNNDRFTKENFVTENIPALLTSRENELIEVNGVEGKIRNASLKKVANFMKNHPEESVNILRAWLATESSIK
ncbi:flagellar basal-body MS-ring/collar protein FliF [Kozakia baliensis]|uniref:flagellar basal-body MS-ring/collar protein FliF n=1 Tax=Kozakia baliensis TaxID=153496 RepID=UPI00345BDB99